MSRRTLWSRSALSINWPLAPTATVNLRLPSSAIGRLVTELVTLARRPEEG